MNDQQPHSTSRQPNSDETQRTNKSQKSSLSAAGQAQPSSGRYWWHRQTIAETFQRIAQQPEFPWVAIGDFIDEWRRSDPADRLALVADGIPQLSDLHVAHAQNVENAETFLQRWAAFCAAMVEWLCWQCDLPWPAWTNREEYHLRTPWFLYPGDLLRPWELVTTPAPFKMRNIFGGDHILDRV